MLSITVQALYLFDDFNGKNIDILIHFLKIFYFSLLFNGIFASVVKYHYNRLQDEREYMNQILNILPIGISTYDDELKLTFYNEKGKNLLESNSKEDRKMENIIEKFCGSRKTDKNLIRMAFENSNSIRNKIITLNSGDKKNVKLVVDVLKLMDGDLCLYSEAKRTGTRKFRLQTQIILIVW